MTNYEQNRFAGNLMFAMSQTLIYPYERHLTPDEIAVDGRLQIVAVEWHGDGWLRVWGRVSPSYGPEQSPEDVCSRQYRLSPSDGWRTRDYARALAAHCGCNIMVKSK